MLIKYANWEDTLSLDKNSNPVLWGIDSNGNIRQISTDSSWNISTVQTWKQLQTEVGSSYSEIKTQWNEFTWVQAWDFTTFVSWLNWFSHLVLSADPTKVGESSITLNQTVNAPARFETAFSYIRGTQAFATCSIFANWTNWPDAVPNPINILSAYQSSADFWASYNSTAWTIITINMETALPSVWQTNAVFIWDWINIDWFIDSRLNYQNLCIKYISPDRKTITCGFSDEVALTSLAIATVTPTLWTAKVYFYNNMSGAKNGIGLRMTGSTTTSNAIVSIRNWDDNQISGTLLGDHRVTTASTTTILWANSLGSAEFRATARFRLTNMLDKAYYSDAADNSFSSFSPRDTARYSSKPENVPLTPRFRIYRPLNMSRPIASIISATKSGTTTATVVTDIPHGLTTGNFVTTKWARDVTNFPNLTTPVAVTVINETTFTLVWWSAVTATTNGWVVVICNGSKDMPSQFIAPQSIQSYSVDANNFVTLIWNTTWTQVSVDYVNLKWVVLTTWVSAWIDWMYQVASISTSTLVLMPIIDNWVSLSPVLPLTTTTNCGWAVLIRPTLRIFDWQIHTVSNSIEESSQSTTNAVNVNIAWQSVAVTQSTSASVSTTDWSGGWLIRPWIVGIADIASAALTSSSTTASISNIMGNSFQVTIPVTAVTGTSPSLDVTIEESYDGGTNWIPLYQFQRITGTGIYTTPILRCAGRNIRYVQTLGWTSPSFTRSVTRILLPFHNAEPQKRIFDRTVSLTTLNAATSSLFSGASNYQQIVAVVTAITGTLGLTMQWSEDGTNWYDIGTALSITAAGTYSLRVNESVTFARVRVSTAATTATLGYISIKSFS